MTTLRCKAPYPASATRAILVAAALGLLLLLSAAAYAQVDEHGFSIASQCDTVERCPANPDAVCDDDIVCTDEACVEGASSEVVCTFTIGNDDDFGDTLTLTTDVTAELTNCDGAGCPNFDLDLTIIAVNAPATCAAGPALPCDLTAPGGSVQFQADGYNVTATEDVPLTFLASGALEDQCDGDPDPGCQEDLGNAIIQRNITLVDGCAPSVPNDDACDDDLTCTTEVCDPEDAQADADGCVITPDDTVCDDADECNGVETCDPNGTGPTGCVEGTPPDPPPLECVPVEGDFVCRTCGFWGNHPAITQQLLDDADPPIAICGGPDMDTTEPEIESSANEAICTKGGGIQQLARQLTCLALNCQFSTGPPLDEAGLVPVDNICTGQTAGGVDLGALFGECNLACDNNTALVGSCIERVDCVNNGGTPVQVNGDWTCAAGECSIDGELCGFEEGDCAENTCEGGFCTLSLNGPVACTTDEDCEATQLCEPFEAENCHERDLCPEGENTYCFEPPGRARPDECKDSRKSKCTYAGQDCDE